MALGLLALGLGVLTAPEALASSHYDEAVEITVPVEGTYTDDYDAGRAGGRVHRATDIFNEMGTKVYAAMGGTVTWAPTEEHVTAGFALQIEGDDGRKYAYYHLGQADGSRADALAEGVDEGVRVERGQLIGYLGNSGNARTTPPHLHFEIHDPSITDPHGSERVNPYASLEHAHGRGDYPGAVADGATEGEEGGRDLELSDSALALEGDYTVKEGDTLSKIAADLGLDGWEVLAGLNPEIEDPDVILVGQTLRLLDREHTVEEGDTLSEIAAALGLDGWEELADLNPEIDDPDLIVPGQRLRIEQD